MRFVEGRQGTSVPSVFGRRQWHVPAHVLATTLCGVALASCGPGPGERPAARAHIPLPSATLLKTQPEPACEYNGASADQALLRKPLDPKAADAAAEAALRTKLDYERQCYRHAELITRQRLHTLQASVRTTIRAIERDAP
jgi:hypothetical protein